MASPQEIVAVSGNNKLAIVLISKNRYVYMWGGGGLGTKTFAKLELHHRPGQGLELTTFETYFPSYERSAP